MLNQGDLELLQIQLNTQTPVRPSLSNLILCSAAGFLSFLRSCIRIAKNESLGHHPQRQFKRQLLSDTTLYIWLVFLDFEVSWPKTVVIVTTAHVKLALIILYALIHLTLKVCRRVFLVRSDRVLLGANWSKVCLLTLLVGQFRMISSDHFI